MFVMDALFSKLSLLQMSLFSFCLALQTSVSFEIFIIGSLNARTEFHAFASAIPGANLHSHLQISFPTIKKKTSGTKNKIFF